MQQLFKFFFLSFLTIRRCAKDLFTSQAHSAYLNAEYKKLKKLLTKSGAIAP
jgi:hypothetical protein